MQTSKMSYNFLSKKQNKVVKRAVSCFAHSIENC
jgi:hypothetical protein